MNQYYSFSCFENRQLEFLLWLNIARSSFRGVGKRELSTHQVCWFVDPLTSELAEFEREGITLV